MTVEETLGFIDKDLPNEDELLDLLVKTDQKDLTVESLREMKVDFLNLSAEVGKKYNKFVRNMFDKGADEIVDTLRQFSFCLGTMIGLGEAIKERLNGKRYVELTERSVSGGKEDKLSQGDRKEFADLEVATLKGMIDALERILDNVKNRLYSYQDMKRKFN